MTDTRYETICNGPVARVRLTNPDRHNAFDDALIAGLTDAFKTLGSDDAVRVVVLEAEGKSFSAGADLGWMKRVAGYSHDENLEDARGLARMLRTLNFLPKPVIGRIQGAAFGGGVGLAACCDIAIGSTKASFCLSETKLGLIPGAISPYVVSAIGQRAARRFFMTAERFDAETALRLGLLHDVVAPDALDAAIDGMIETLLSVGPKATAEAKALVFAMDRPFDEAVAEESAARIARIRTTPEAQEGLSAFFEKRRPSWTESS